MSLIVTACFKYLIHNVQHNIFSNKLANFTTNSSKKKTFNHSKRGIFVYLLLYILLFWSVNDLHIPDVKRIQWIAWGCACNMAATPIVKVMSTRGNFPLNPFVRHQSSIAPHSYLAERQPLPVSYFILLVESADGDDEEVLPLCLQRGETGSQQGDQQQTGEQQPWSPKEAPGKGWKVPAGGAEGRTSSGKKDQMRCQDCVIIP